MKRRAHKFIRNLAERLKTFVDRLWYPGFLGLLAFIDVFTVVVPTDGFLISSTMLRPKKWFSFAFWITIGSTVGSLIVAVLVEVHGLPLVLHLYPGIDQTHAWSLTDQFFDKYGLLLVFVVAASPFFQQPTVILASLAKTSIVSIVIAVFFGRLLKFLFIAYLASHAPKLITRIWGLKEELIEVGVEPDSKD